MRILQKRKIVYRKWDERLNRPIPAVVLSGKFLADFGFRFPGYYLVDYRPGIITVSLLNNKVASLLPERN